MGNELVGGHFGKQLVNGGQFCVGQGKVVGRPNGAGERPVEFVDQIDGRDRAKNKWPAEMAATFGWSFLVGSQRIGIERGIEERKEGMDLWHQLKASGLFLLSGKSWLEAKEQQWAKARMEEGQWMRIDGSRAEDGNK